MNEKRKTPAGTDPNPGDPGPEIPEPRRIGPADAEPHEESEPGAPASQRPHRSP